MSFSRDAFDPFTSDDWQENGQSTTEAQQHQADPWSSDTWGTSLDFQNTTIETSFDSAGLFDINAAPSSEVISDVLNDEASSLFFPEFGGGEGLSNSSRGDEEKAIQVAIHEQLSCLYDGKANSGHVDGSIHVRPSKGTTKSFALMIHDANGHIEKLTADSRVCHDVTVEAPDTIGIDDTTLRVSIPLGFNPMSPLARYRCTNDVYPIPLLVKSKVHVVKNACRVQIKIRANPANRSALTDLAIILAVPPDILGESAKMTQQGGLWDGMKRIVAWSIGEIDPGQMIHVHVQFQFVLASEEEPDRATPKFPILVRCSAIDELFSGISLSAADAYDLTEPVRMNVSRTVRILHRKV